MMYFTRILDLVFSLRPRDLLDLVFIAQNERIVRQRLDMHVTTFERFADAPFRIVGGLAEVHFTIYDLADLHRRSVLENVRTTELGDAQETEMPVARCDVPHPSKMETTRLSDR